MKHTYTQHYLNNITTNNNNSNNEATLTWHAAYTPHAPHT